MNNHNRLSGESRRFAGAKVQPLASRGYAAGYHTTTSLQLLALNHDGQLLLEQLRKVFCKLVESVEGDAVEAMRVAIASLDRSAAMRAYDCCRVGEIEDTPGSRQPREPGW